MSKPLVVVTPGDPAGIGPEIVLTSLRKGKLTAPGFSTIVIGALAPFEKLRSPARFWTFVTEDQVRAGVLPPLGKRRAYFLAAPASLPPGGQAGWSVTLAAKLCLEGRAAALVTGPLHKERLQAGGYPYVGHTDLLEALCPGSRAVMMLANQFLRVTLVTVHTSLARVPQAVTAEKVLSTILTTSRALQTTWGIKKPRVAITALNPHAGEGGLFGDEETRVIAPAIAEAAQVLGSTASLSGPLPADTLFAQHIAARKRRRSKEYYDAVVCMYHDQGLIPVKLLDFPNTVNVTLGLPLIRTSVDHGTAFDIVGKGVADPSSLQAAFKLALTFIKNSRNPLDKKTQRTSS